MNYIFSNYNIVSEKNNAKYVVNTITGTLIRLDDRMYRIIKAQNIDELTDKEKDILYKNGILIDSGIKEKNLLRAAYNSYCRSRKSATVIVCPTMECNFGCPYCFEERQQGSMSNEVKEGVVRYIDKLTASGYESFDFEWFGGEPLLYPGIIEELSDKIICLCKNRHVKFSFAITTNGYCINEKVLSIFQKIHLSEARITLDGNKESHDKRRCLRNGKGTFDEIVSNIKKLSALGIHVKVRVNIDKDNPHAFAQVKEALSGIDNLYLYPANVVEEPTQDNCQKKKCYTSDEFNEFHQSMYNEYGFKPTYEGLFKHGVSCCMAEHDGSCVIDHNGYVYKCVNDVCHPEWAICNVLDKNESKNPKAVSKYLGRDPIDEIPCRDCKFLPLCYGGCVYEFERRESHSCARAKYLLDDIIAEKLGI